MDIQHLLTQLDQSPETLVFKEIIAAIDAAYEFSPVAFLNNGLENAQGENQGSCKVFAFAKLHNLSKNHTLALFAEHFFKSVLLKPDGTDHQNIRHFLKSEDALNGVVLSGNALSLKN
jgi:hypothetical protein